MRILYNEQFDTSKYTGVVIKSGNITALLKVYDKIELELYNDMMFWFQPRLRRRWLDMRADLEDLFNTVLRFNRPKNNSFNVSAILFIGGTNSFELSLDVDTLELKFSAYLLADILTHVCVTYKFGPKLKYIMLDDRYTFINSNVCKYRILPMAVEYSFSLQFNNPQYPDFDFVVSKHVLAYAIIVRIVKDSEVRERMVIGKVIDGNNGFVLYNSDGFIVFNGKFEYKFISPSISLLDYTELSAADVDMLCANI